MSKQNLIKLPETITSDGVKIIELYNKIDNGILEPRPAYQRKLVWKKHHKFAFIETILSNYPFPEVYIASADIDVETMMAKEVVVDGQQRLTTIVEYIKGLGDFENQKQIPAFNMLETNEKKEFLNYKVTVKDLKDIEEPIIKEIFQRINSTEYSLNSVEKNNAIFGDGEIATFCKQLIDKDTPISEEQTDIIIDYEDRVLISEFFIENDVFSDNDIKRMYDFQYIMLLISTIMEGSYYGRSSKVIDYLDDYNASFPNYKDVLYDLKKAVITIKKLGFNKKSYWFNKANLFTLIIELTKFKNGNIDLEKLRIELLDLEDKVDIYFLAEEDEDLLNISDDEKKYFEVARQGSHEKAAREHRGKVISEILTLCSPEEASPESTSSKNINYLHSKRIDYSRIIPTKTGLTKGIMDATLPVREFFKKVNIHDYDSQINGPEHKKKIIGYFIDKEFKKATEVSLYKATKRGDTRIWFSGVKDFTEPNETLVLLVLDGILYIANIDRVDLEESVSFRCLLE